MEVPAFFYQARTWYGFNIWTSSCELFLEEHSVNTKSSIPIISYA